MRALVVTRSRVQELGLSAALERAGAQVLVVPTLAEAEAALRRFWPDLVVMAVDGNAEVVAWTRRNVARGGVRVTTPAGLPELLRSLGRQVA